MEELPHLPQTREVGFWCNLFSSAAIAYLQKSLGGFTINSLPSREECAGGVKALIILGIIIRACQTQFLPQVSLQSSLHAWSFSSSCLPSLQLVLCLSPVGFLFDPAAWSLNRLFFRDFYEASRSS